MLTVAQVRGWAGKALAVADLITQMTPFSADDEVVRRVRRLIDSDPFMEVAVDGLNFLVDLFARNGDKITAADADRLKAKIGEARAEVFGSAG